MLDRIRSYYLSIAFITTQTLKIYKSKNNKRIFKNLVYLNKKFNYVFLIFVFFLFFFVLYKDASNILS